MSRLEDISTDEELLDEEVLEDDVTYVDEEEYYDDEEKGEIEEEDEGYSGTRGKVSDPKANISPLPSKKSFVRKKSKKKRRRPAKKRVTRLLNQDDILREKTFFSKTEKGFLSGFAVGQDPSRISIRCERANLSTLVSAGKKSKDLYREHWGGNLDPYMDCIDQERGQDECLKALCRQEWSGVRKLTVDPEFVKSIEDSQTIEEEITINVSELSPHRNETDYVCPRIEVMKVNPKTKLIQRKQKRVWETNLFDQSFKNLKRADMSLKSSFSFQDLVCVEMFSNENVLLLTFRDASQQQQSSKKIGFSQRRLHLSSKLVMWRLYELLKFSIKEKPTWVPELLSFKKKEKPGNGLRKINLSGKVSYHLNRSGFMVNELKKVDGTNFLVGSQYEKICVFCVSWNINNISKFPEDASFMNDLIRPGADMYVICFQGLNVKTKFESYRNFLIEYFRKRLDFLIVNATRSQDVGMFLFVDKKYCRRISQIQWTTKTFPTKLKSCRSCGSVNIRLLFNESRMAFVGVHLPLGSSPRTKRNILEAVFSEPSFFHDENEHHVFLLADMNYKLSLDPAVAVCYWKKKKNLMDFDQFLIHRSQSRILHSFEEGEIRFPPTKPIESEGNYTEDGTWKFQEECDFLSYSNRILVRTVPGGPKCDILVYDSVHSLGHVSNSAAICGIYAVDTQRTHISHFTPPIKAPRVLQVVEMHVGKSSECKFKAPIIVMEADWLESSPIMSIIPSKKKKKKKKKKKGVLNPKFKTECFPQLLCPVKSSDDFLRSCYLRVSIKDEMMKKKEEGGVLARGVINVSCCCVGNNGWFSVPMYLRGSFVCQLMGLIQANEKSKDD